MICECYRNFFIYWPCSVRCNTNRNEQTNKKRKEKFDVSTGHLEFNIQRERE